MGTTAATLHIALPYGGSRDPSAPLAKAYARLGWGTPKPGETAARSVRLVRNETPFVSIYDSACEQLDDGTLKQLAALLSKALNTAAIVATVNDSDVFEFLLYSRGKQIDAVTDGPDGVDASLKSLRGKRQATKWLEAFGLAWLRKAGGEPAVTSAAAMDAFVARAKAIDQMNTPFSEQRLEAWCELAGLQAHAATATSAERESEVVARLDLASRPATPKKTVTVQAPAGRTLSYLFSADDHPYHGYFPAAYPMPPGATQGFSWAVVCRDGGIGRLTLRVDIDGSGPFEVCDLTAHAHSFYNGQITSERPLTAAEHGFSDGVSERRSFSLDAAEFNLPAPAAGSRTAAILLLKARVRSAAAGEFTLRPTLIADSAELTLPPLRIAAMVPSWIPLVAEGAKPDVLRLVRVLRLNRPAVHSAVAILRGDDAAALQSARHLIEQALSLVGGAESRVALDTHKHLSQSFRVPKSHAELPLQGLTTAPLWSKLFDAGHGYHTVRIGLAPPGAPWAYAGFSMQTSLRKSVRGEALAPDAATTSVAVWAIAEAEAREALGLDWNAIVQTFSEFMRDAAALQGWVADCAWIPEFDTYEDFRQTPYESLSPVDWFRSGHQGLLTTQTWLRRRLRFISPRIWLGEALASRVDHAALADVAEVAPVRKGCEVVLKRGLEMQALELALLPILPNSL
jgi:hypothetical protein